MRKRRQKLLFRKALRFKSRESRYEQKMNSEARKNYQEWRKLETNLGAIQFTFREGFPERVTGKLLNLLEKDPMREFYASLSSLFPKIAYSSLFVLILIIAAIFVLHGELDHNVLLGTDKIDDSNFISYLIFQSN